MEISAKLKERFCKDCNIPIKIFQEPYFMDRMKLYDKFYGTLEKWETFVKELEKYKCEQDYLEEYNRVKDTAINDIKETEAYQRFNSENMNEFSIVHEGLPGKDIFHPSNNGRKFISIDMKKANFSALKYYNYSMFYESNTWEDFIKRYTDNKHIINSKYIRQVILGNCNPKRHITYEKYLMDTLLEILEDFIIRQERFIGNKLVFFSNDEIVFDIEDINEDKIEEFLKEITYCIDKLVVPFKVEYFLLSKIDGTNGYCKTFKDGSVEFKCLDNYMLPFVMRKVLGQEVTENDKVFYHEGLLAKFIEVPEIKNI